MSYNKNALLFIRLWEKLSGEGAVCLSLEQMLPLAWKGFN